MKTCINTKHPIGDFRTSQPAMLGQRRASPFLDTWGPAICCHAAMQQHPWKPSLPPGTSHWIGKSLGHPTWISCETWFHGYETMASHNITANQQNKMGNCLPNVGFPWPVLGNVAPAPVWDTEAKNFSWVQQQIALDRRWYFLGAGEKQTTIGLVCWPAKCQEKEKHPAFEATTSPIIWSHPNNEMVSTNLATQSKQIQTTGVKWRRWTLQLANCS